MISMLLLHDTIPDSPLFGFVLLYLFAPPILGVISLVAYLRKRRDRALFWFVSGVLLLIGHAVFLQAGGNAAVPVWWAVTAAIVWWWWKLMRGSD